jgi:Rad3-related DNA helicase
MNIHESWNNTFDYPPRTNQVTALDWLADQTAKYILLEIPVGGGKSNLAITHSKWLQANRSNDMQRSSFIITPQRILQEQYETSFKGLDLASLYGKSNYVCRDKGTTCDIGVSVNPKCLHCPHKAAKNKARTSQNVVLNYRLALTSFAYTETFNRRNLMVFDECHSIEDHLVGFDALEITNKRCQRYGFKFKSHTKIGEALKWMKDYYLPLVLRQVDLLTTRYEWLRNKSGNELTSSDIKNIRELDGFTSHADEVELMALRNAEYVEENFVLVNSIDRFQFKRLTGAYSFEKLCEPMADQFLFMSSTILDKQGFCEDIGIKPDEAAMLSLGSEFPVENRPVYFMPAMRMNKSWNDDTNKGKRSKAIKDLKEIIKIHKDDSGIIHTGNYAIANWLAKELVEIKSHDIYHHNAESKYANRNDAINGFMEGNKPSILISPSSTEGLDLKDDLSRFAIFMKVPFGSLGDQWIKRKMEISNKWYRRRALIDIIQGGGRIVRSEDDKGAVYILDDSFAFLYKQSRAMVPKWWNESYHKV